MKNIDNGRKYTSKVFYLNEENKQKIKDEKNVVYSKDGRYAMVYTQEDFDFMERFWEALEKDDFYQAMSLEDEIYEIMLDEAGVEPFKPGIVKHIVRPRDDEFEEIISFGETCIIPTCIINKKKSLSEGSDIIIIMGSNEQVSLVVRLSEENENGR